jgi:NhaP-type Na+/H+ and K+/H+ antiporter
MASKIEYEHWIQSTSIQYGSDTWILNVWPSKASLEEAHIYYNIPHIALMIGLLISLLISGMLYLFGAVKRQNKEIASKGSTIQLIHEITAIIRQDISFNEMLERSINCICLESGKLNNPPGYTISLKITTSHAPHNARC